MPLMKSLRDVRLTNTSGHCIPVVANEPKNIPPDLYQVALASGMVECEKAPAPIVEAEADDPADDEITGEAREKAIEAAVLKLIVRNDEADFKADLTPKVTKVIVELGPEFTPRPTATEVLDAFNRAQDNMALAED